MRATFGAGSVAISVSMCPGHAPGQLAEFRLGIIVEHLAVPVARRPEVPGSIQPPPIPRGTAHDSHAPVGTIAPVTHTLLTGITQ